ncbi:MAG: diguanylate cyclase domain-containing protein [Leptolyngbyaceae cyanobacterium]
MCPKHPFHPNNDSREPLAGDAVFRQVAQILAKAIPRTLELLSRYGGEEFALFTMPSNARSANYDACV